MLVLNNYVKYSTTGMKISVFLNEISSHLCARLAILQMKENTLKRLSSLVSSASGIAASILILLCVI